MKTALLIIDLQNDYFKGGSMELMNPEKAGENARLLLDRFRSEGKPVVHIQHIATKPDATFFLPDTRGAEIHSLVSPENGEKIVVKHFPNSFRETELLEFLKSQQITQLVVSGMMTHMCVDATVRAAHDLGFAIRLVGDACATKELEISGTKVKASDVHHAFLAALNHTYCSVFTTELLLNTTL
ncbi:MAG: cysteine hydrolase [Bacteroidales bacterium]|nr:cysteine hydrolase [Bacteroidales bacterium]